MSVTGTYRTPRSDDPIDRLLAVAAIHPAIAAEYVSESPGWGQVFMGRNLRDATKSEPVAIITHDGAAWCVSVHADADGFYADESGSGQVAVIDDTDGTRYAEVFARAIEALATYNDRAATRAKRTDDAIRAAQEAMDEALGAALVATFPEATTGDESPDTLFARHMEIEASVRSWVENNVPK